VSQVILKPNLHTRAGDDKQRTRNGLGRPKASISWPTWSIFLRNAFSALFQLRCGQEPSTLGIRDGNELRFRRHVPLDEAEDGAGDNGGQNCSINGNNAGPEVDGAVQVVASDMIVAPA
jgi:hypothetical protein